MSIFPYLLFLKLYNWIHTVGFFKSGLFGPGIFFFEKFVSILKYFFYSVRVDFIGSHGSSCLADVKNL